MGIHCWGGEKKLVWRHNYSIVFDYEKWFLIFWFVLLVFFSSSHLRRSRESNDFREAYLHLFWQSHWDSSCMRLSVIFLFLWIYIYICYISFIGLWGFTHIWIKSTTLHLNKTRPPYRLFLFYKFEDTLNSKHEKYYANIASLTINSTRVLILKSWNLIMVQCDAQSLPCLIYVSIVVYSWCVVGVGGVILIHWLSSYYWFSFFGFVTPLELYHINISYDLLKHIYWQHA